METKRATRLNRASQRPATFFFFFGGVDSHGSLSVHTGSTDMANVCPAASSLLSRLCASSPCHRRASELRSVHTTTRSRNPRDEVVENYHSNLNT